MFQWVIISLKSRGNVVLWHFSIVRDRLPYDYLARHKDNDLPPKGKLSFNVFLLLKFGKASREFGAEQ